MDAENELAAETVNGVTCYFWCIENKKTGEFDIITSPERPTVALNPDEVLSGPLPKVPKVSKEIEAMVEAWDKEIEDERGSIAF